MQNKSTIKLLIAATGSVATIKLIQLTQTLSKLNIFQIKIVLTKSAIHFIKKQLQSLTSKYTVHFDQQQWQWQKRGDPVLHIQLRKWADILLIAPLSANTLAKITHGICDNLLTLIIRCWDLRKDEKNRLIKKIIICPSMNSYMWINPISQKQLDELKERGYIVLGPVQKILMCGQKGVGAMEEVKNIVQYLQNSTKQ